MQWNSGDNFLNGAYKDLKVDFVIANPPFNDSDYSGKPLRDDEHWKFGYPLALMQIMREFGTSFIIFSPKAEGFILAKGSLTSNTSTEGKICKKKT